VAPAAAPLAPLLDAPLATLPDPLDTTPASMLELPLLAPLVTAPVPLPDTLIAPLDPLRAPVIAAPLMALAPDDCPDDEVAPVLEVTGLAELPQAAQATTSHDAKVAVLEFMRGPPLVSGWAR
jgi:hypothetical protein